jgi:hypothetical protein
MKTASWMVTYAKGQIGRPYWYGTFGQVANETLLKQKRAQYPNYYNQVQGVIYISVRSKGARL